MGRHFRNHKMSVWQRLIPRLEEAGKESSIYYGFEPHSAMHAGPPVAGMAAVAPSNGTRLPPQVWSLSSF